MENVPALDPESDSYGGAPESKGDSIDWKSYEEMYKTGEFPAVKPDNK